jgi:hypothetical protein
MDICIYVRSNKARNGSIENIQAKLVSNKRGANQVDKRYISAYRESFLSDMPDNVYTGLRLYTGELPPIITNCRDEEQRRMYMDELQYDTRVAIIKYLTAKKSIILNGIFKGTGDRTADWLLIRQKYDDVYRTLVRSMPYAIKFFGGGKVTISEKGNIKLGRVTLQRKGGDKGKRSACMAQFKIDPIDLLDNEYKIIT